MPENFGAFSSMEGADVDVECMDLDPALVLQERRCNVAGQAILSGHISLGNKLISAFGILSGHVRCLASAIYSMARYPRWSLARSIAEMEINFSNPMISSGRKTNGINNSGLQFNARTEYNKSLDRAKGMCTLTEWKSLVGQVIMLVKRERQWWGSQCEVARQRELPSQLIHMFGVALQNLVWPVMRLLVYTGQFQKGVDYAKTQKPMSLGIEH